MSIGLREGPYYFRMRDRGAFFQNTIVQAPFTIPSHFVMLTGWYPVRTGVGDMHLASFRYAGAAGRYCPDGTLSVFLMGKKVKKSH